MTSPSQARKNWFLRHKVVTTATFVAAAFVALLGVLMVPTAPPASAYPGGSCSIVVPTTVSIDRPYKLIPATLASDCTANYADYASCDVRHSYYGPSDIFIFDGTRSDTISFYDWEHYGVYYVEPGNAWNNDYYDLTQNTRSYVVKSASQAGIRATRAGSYVTVSVGAAYYSPTTSAFRMWGNERVQIQYRTPNTSTWRTLRNVYTASNGKAAYRYYAPKARFYRAVTAPNSVIWSQWSIAIYR
ncbi:MAG: hypothetical protein IMZ75_00665 [Actinobacteria bacterium]|nr:hypothetical protein [Actinomycetota bacterium]